MKPNTIVPARRTYNKLIANEMMEDFALRFTARRARRWSMSWIANTALGTVSFLVLEALGGAITLSYGVNNALWAIAAVSFIVILSGLPISYYAARYGVDIDLLSRGAGFGYLGSTIASLIYASFTFIFFALEAAVMAAALELLIGLPMVLGYIFSALVVIPLVTHGITNIGRFQLWSQPIWFLLQVVPLYFVFTHPDTHLDGWLNYTGIHDDGTNQFNFLLFGAASAVLLSIVAQIGEQVDFLRFMAEPQPGKKLKWWAAVFAAGPGWIFVGAAKMVLGSLLAYLALQHGIAAADAGKPAYMYQMVFSFITDNKGLALWLAAVFVIISQIKINVANAYAGSLAWSNYFSRLTHSHPGRVVWVFFNVSIALMLMLLGVYEALEKTLQIYSVLVLAWIGSIVADLLINKPLGLSPKHIEFKRSRLYDINPVGVVSMLLASAVGLLGHLNVFGEVFKACSSFVSFFLPFATAPLIAWYTKGRYYLLQPDTLCSDKEQLCSVCEVTFEQEDMAHCPAYDTPICSLCCSLDVRCESACRPKATFAYQARRFMTAVFPKRMIPWLLSSQGQFSLVMSGISLIMALILLLVYAQLPDDELINQTVGGAFLKAFFLLSILIGVVSWLFILARNSNNAAVEESRIQADQLNQEIEAHQKTYTQLQRSKEAAENANQAKNRYLAGISHELRTPLNILLGYAQLLSNNQKLPAEPRNHAQIMHRNGEHLADLIEGLLEISKIEAGRLELAKDHIHTPSFLQQIADMFTLQANNKGISFHYLPPNNLPEWIAADKKRLRQILINLLSNAVKFTQQGSVTFSLSFRNDVAYFSIKDTGIGIEEQYRDAIFGPFERIRTLNTQSISGTGLGLTISRALAQLMGGDIVCSSTLGQGSEFTLTMLLPRVVRPAHESRPNQTTIDSYTSKLARPFTLLTVDDDGAQRQLLSDMLVPLGFNILQAANAFDAEALLDTATVDLILLDILMPEVDGWQLSQRLRQRGIVAPIVMLSANTLESDHEKYQSPYHDDHLSKPVDLKQLLTAIGRLLPLEWQSPEATSGMGLASPLPAHNFAIPEAKFLQNLKQWAEIGYLAAFNENLDHLENNGKAEAAFVTWMRSLSAQCEFEKIVTYLDQLIDESNTLV